jgi:maltose O-acetyltransferase
MQGHSQKERMTGCGLYLAGDDQLRFEHRRCHDILWEINHSRPSEEKRRQELFRKLFCSIGGTFKIVPPFYCDYGIQISIGENFYANTNCVILDPAPVRIGDNVMFAPFVQLYTAAHPIDPGVRATGVEYAKTITIGDDVWIGGGAIINPGVAVGKGSVIGAGAVVTKDIPPGVIAAGNPAKVLRAIGKDDKERWETLYRRFLDGQDAVP